MTRKDVIIIMDRVEHLLAQVGELEQTLQLTDQLVIGVAETVDSLAQRVELLEEYMRLRLQELQQRR